jgi:hypothetical protein
MLMPAEAWLGVLLGRGEALFRPSRTQRGALPPALSCNPCMCTQVYVLASRLFIGRDTTTSRSEWPNLYQDLIEMASPAVSVQQRRAIVSRMMSVYTIFQL